MKIVDVCTFNGEKEIWDLRYNILKDYVDEFIVVEFDKTFSGKPKEKLFNQHYWNDDLKGNIKHFFVPEAVYNKYKDLALSSPNTQYGKIDHFVREFCQKESIKDCLVGLKDDDIVFIGDVDEIVDPLAIKIIDKILKLLPNGAIKFNLKVYAYWLNNKSNEQFWGTLCTTYARIKDECLNHLRTNKELCNKETVGWHFTSMAKSLKQKLKDSYTHEDYATEEILDNLEENIENDKDFLGRNFTYSRDETDWPDYLKKNRDKYKHLLKP